jgi:hypothetical protein
LQNFDENKFQIGWIINKKPYMYLLVHLNDKVKLIYLNYENMKILLVSFLTKIKKKSLQLIKKYIKYLVSKNWY